MDVTSRLSEGLGKAEPHRLHIPHAVRLEGAQGVERNAQPPKTYLKKQTSESTTNHKELICVARGGPSPC